MRAILTKTQKYCLIILMLLVPSALEAAVARFELVEGRVLEGEIVSFNDGSYTLRLQNGDEVKVDEKSVKVISYQGEPAADLRLAGSNTVGERLVPDLVEAFVTGRGGQGVKWQEGQLKNERRLVVGETKGAKLPRSVHVAAHGTATGFVALKKGEADVAMASRPINDAEFADLSDKGDLREDDTEHTIALDGVAVIVHSKNRVSALTTEQIAQIFSCEFTDWSQVGGASGPIMRYLRDDNSGTFDTFKHLVLDAYHRTLCPGAKRFESSTDLSKAVAADPNGIGAIGLPYVKPARALRILECDIAYGDTPFAIKSEEYPLSRRLFLYTPERPSSPFVGDFVEFALSDKGQEVAEKEFVSLAIQSDADNTQEARLVAAGLVTKSAAALKDLLQTTKGASRLSVTFRFRPNSVRLDTRGKRDLDRLASFMRTPAAQGKSLLLLGFADNHGNYQANEELSRRRAEAVAQRLREKGVTVILVKGFGEEAPVACNTTPVGTERNRHVEVWLR